MGQSQILMLGWDCGQSQVEAEIGVRIRIRVEVIQGLYDTFPYPHHCPYLIPTLTSPTHLNPTSTSPTPTTLSLQPLPLRALPHPNPYPYPYQLYSYQTPTLILPLPLSTTIQLPYSYGPTPTYNPYLYIPYPLPSLLPARHVPLLLSPRSPMQPYPNQYFHHTTTSDYRTLGYAYGISPLQWPVTVYMKYFSKDKHNNIDL